MRILLIEDDYATAQAMELMLRSERMKVRSTEYGAEGIRLAGKSEYDMILLDLNLPDMSGYEVLRTLRLQDIKTPIMIVSGMAGIEDKVRGLGFGADDYMTKPFHRDELVARIHAIVRRTNGYTKNELTFGKLHMDLAARRVRIGEQELHLTRQEYDTLEILALRPDRAISKEAFVEHLYNGVNEPDKKIIDVLISKLRKKLANCGLEGLIETKRGRGWYIRSESALPAPKKETAPAQAAIAPQDFGITATLPVSYAALSAAWAASPAAEKPVVRVSMDISVPTLKP